MAGRIPPPKFILVPGPVKVSPYVAREMKVAGRSSANFKIQSRLVTWWAQCSHRGLKSWRGRPEVWSK